MSDPCKYNDDIQDIKKVLFIGNGNPPLLSQMAEISAKIESIHSTTDTWDAKMDALLDFMAVGKAMKLRSEKRLGWGLGISGVLIAAISLWLTFTKLSAPQVKEQIQAEKIIENKAKTDNAKDASYKKEIKSQLSKDTIK